MLAALSNTWWFLRRRLRADWLVVAVTFLTVLLTASLLAAGPIYADGVAVAGLRRTLRDAPPTATNIELTIQAASDSYPALDDQVTPPLQHVLLPTGGEIRRAATSGPFTLLDREVDSDITVFAFFEAVEEHATLSAGQWPAESTGPAIEVALSTAAAALLDLRVGDRLAVQSRLDRENAPGVTVVGIYQLNQANDPYWYDDPLVLDGTVGGEVVTTYGPMLVSEQAFLNQVAPRSPAFSWRVFPTFEQLELGEYQELIANLQALEGRLNAAVGPAYAVELHTELGAILSAAEQSLLATRSGVLIPTIQLGVLAGYALVLTAGLLVAQRSIQTALLRTRGAPARFVALAALSEGLLLALPAALLGPWLAAFALRALNHVGPLAGIGLHLPTSVNRSAYLLAGLASLVCVVVLTLPAVTSARSIAGLHAARGREGRRAFWQRSGLDIGLLVLALIALTQLRRYGLPITRSVQGRLEVDPFLVAAPALGMLAGAVIALRMLPLFSRVVERLAPRSRGLVPVLAFWQIARRPVRYGRSALLLMLALGIGLFAVAYTRTWETSQQDQADYEIGADVGVRPSLASESLSNTHLDAAYRSLDGVTSVTAMVRRRTTLPGALGNADVVLLDSDEAGATVRIRNDLVEEPFTGLMDQLTERRPEVTGIPLPGQPQRLALTVRSMIQAACPREPGEGAASAPEEEHSIIGGLPCASVELASDEVYRQFDTPLSAAVVLRDAAGHYIRLTSAQLLSTPDAQRLIFPLTEPIGVDQTALPSYPLELVAIEFSTIAPPEPDAQGFIQGFREGRFSLDAMAVSSQADGEEWSPVPFDAASSAWQADTAQTTFRQAGVPDIWLLDDAAPEGGVRLGFVTGSVFRQITTMPYDRLPVTFRLRPVGSTPPGAIPVIVSAQLLEQVTLGIGDTFLMELDSGAQDAEIVGVVRAFPTTNPEQDVLILADVETVAALRLTIPGAGLLTTDEYWLAVDERHAAQVADQLQLPPFASQAVTSRFERADLLRSDPIALGTIGALTFGFAAAAIFAWIGFLSNAVVSTRERLTEFALLRSLGLGRRQLTAWLLLEQGFLITMSMIGGMALGLLLAWLTFPLIAVTRAATRVFPDVVVVIPWLSIFWLNLTVIGVLVVGSGVLALLLRRLGLGGLLRHGEL